MLIGPAVTVFAGQQLVGYIADKREKKKKRISATEVLLIETEEGLEGLIKFMNLMNDQYISDRLGAEGPSDAPPAPPGSDRHAVLPQ